MNVIRAMLLDNLGLKLVALLLAIAVYLNVFTDRSATMAVSFPIQFTDLPDSLTLAGSVPEAVQAELRGTGKEFIRLWLTEPRFKISLAGVGAGRIKRTVSKDDLPIIASDKLEVERVTSPELLEFQVERCVSRRLPVATRVSGIPRTGFQWPGAVLAEPASVIVRGPQRTVAAMDSVRLALVRIDGRRDTVRTAARPDALPDWCTVDPAAVGLTIPIARVQL